MFRVFTLTVVILSTTCSDALIPDTATPLASLMGAPGAGREPVAFSAIKASQSTKKASNKIAFTKTLTDIGFGWRADRSEFVCFYPGTYYFFFSAIPSSGSQLKISLMKNTDEVVTAAGDRIGATSGSNSVILNLAKNDRVYLSILDGSLHESKQDSRSYTTFSGFRVY